MIETIDDRQPETERELFPPLQIHTDCNGHRFFIHEGSAVYLPDTRRKYFSRGKMHDYYDSVHEFLTSESRQAVIPMYCMRRENKGKRYLAHFADRGDGCKIYNFEKCGNEWWSNEHNGRNHRSPKQGIEICYPNTAYWVMLKKHDGAKTGYVVLGVKRIKIRSIG